MQSMLIVRILAEGSISIPSTKIYGSVEIRPSSKDLENEVVALKMAAEVANVNYDKLSYCARISTIVNCESINDAIEKSDAIFAEVLDLISLDFPVSNISSSDVGFIKILETGDIIELPRKNPTPLSTSFEVWHGDIQTFDRPNHILSLKCDLRNRYLRSLHWARNGKLEKNQQLRVLFYWFSLEALLKESETDNISGCIRWFLGFPNGKLCNDVDAGLMRRLQNHERYAHWKKALIIAIEEIRIFRNESVHSGFRSIDFSDQNLKLYTKIVQLAAARCQSAVNYSLINKVETVSEFKQYIAQIFESTKNIENDVHGNIIFILDNC